MVERRYLLFSTLLIALLAYLYPRDQSPERIGPTTRQWRGRNNTILFLGNSEPGFSNVLLATSNALLIDYPDMEVHFASFPKLAGNVKSISEFASRVQPNAQSITYHNLTGKTVVECLYSTWEGDGPYDPRIALPSPPGIKGVSKFCDELQNYLMPWSGPEYLEIYQQILDILDEVGPAVVVVEPLFGPGMDAVRTQDRQTVVVSPNSLKDNFGELQPWGSVLWKYPALTTGYTYPVPWRSIPTNIYINLRIGYSILRTPRLDDKRRYLKNNGIAKPLNIFTLYQKDLLWISSSAPNIDWPLSVIPSNVIPAGPIFLSSSPVAERSPELATWLAKAPTVLINLGSSVRYDVYLATQMAISLKKLFAETNVQVLWKMQKKLGEEFDNDSYLSDLTQEIESQRLRVTKWLEVDPAALLETGNIVLSVHHGGANCFHEAIGTGVPHMVLPMWVDLYDFASRAEWLGVGVWGNRKSAPNWTAEELSEAFARAIGDREEARAMREKATELGKHFQQEPGRIRAAREVANLARRGH